MNEADPAVPQENVQTPQQLLRRGDLTLPMVWKTLPVAQFYGLCVTLVALLGSSFGAGIWLGNQDARLELREKAVEWNEKERRFMTDLDELTKSNEQLTATHEILNIKQRFLAFSLAYYQAKKQGEAHTRFVKYLDEMWNNGNQDIEKNGYKIFHSPDEPTKTCYIMFNEPEKVRYKIPSGPKAEVLIMR